MKAILEFSLPEEQKDFEVATKASDWKEAVRLIDDYLRGLVKYQGKEVISIDELREEIATILNEMFLKLHD